MFFAERTLWVGARGVSTAPAGPPPLKVRSRGRRGRARRPLGRRVSRILAVGVVVSRRPQALTYVMVMVSTHLPPMSIAIEKVYSSFDFHFAIERILHLPSGVSNSEWET